MRVRLHFRRGSTRVYTTEYGVDISYMPASALSPGCVWSMTVDETRRLADALNAAASEMEDGQAKRP